MSTVTSVNASDVVIALLNIFVPSVLCFFNRSSPEFSGFKNPKGIYRTKNGELYIADTGAKTVFRFDKNYKYVRQYNKAETGSTDITTNVSARNRTNDLFNIFFIFCLLT